MGILLAKLTLYNKYSTHDLSLFSKNNYRLFIFILTISFHVPAFTYYPFNPLNWPTYIASTFCILNNLTPSFLVRAATHDTQQPSIYGEFSGPFIQRSKGNKVIIHQYCDNSWQIQTVTIDHPINPSLCRVPHINPPGMDSNLQLKITPFENLSLKSHWKMPDKLIAVSDLEGNLPTFIHFLEHNDLINDRGEWIWKKGHLVIVGDSVDRGDYSIELLWFIRALQYQAKRKGGEVHFLLGNHEIMNIEGDVYYASDYQKTLMTILEQNFGFHMFGEKQEMVHWLKQQNAAVKIGRNLFVHGGISKELLAKKYNLPTINQKVRSCINNYKSVICQLISRGLGPLWFRGHFTSYDEVIVADALAFYNVKRIIVGHTPVEKPGPINAHKKVYGLDVNWHTGNGAGIFFGKNGEWRIVHGHDNKQEL